MHKIAPPHGPLKSYEVPSRKQLFARHLLRRKDVRSKKKIDYVTQLDAAGANEEAKNYFKHLFSNPFLRPRKCALSETCAPVWDSGSGAIGFGTISVLIKRYLDVPPSLAADIVDRDSQIKIDLRMFGV
ncbi:unnamed protein product, partial [Iphiclides podalirius]